MQTAEFQLSVLGIYFDTSNYYDINSDESARGEKY